MIGPVLGLPLSGIVCWFLLRRWRRRAAQYAAANLDKDHGNFDNKAQLHADSIYPRSELPDNTETHELKGSAAAKAIRLELPALEPVWSEMDVSESLVEREKLPR